MGACDRQAQSRPESEDQPIADDSLPMIASAPGLAATGNTAGSKPAPSAGTGSVAADAGKAEPPPRVDAGVLDAAVPAPDAAPAMEPAIMPMPSADTPVRPADADCEYIEVRARTDTAGTAYEVPIGENVACFLLDAGFDAPTQALSISPLLDNPTLVDSITLRTLERSDNNRGTMVSCNDTYPTHQMIAVWAPGADDWYYPSDVGVDLGRGLFLLEVHYLNQSTTAASDRSGMRVCTTKQLRPRTASMSYLGDQHFSIPAGVLDHTVPGRCEPVMQTEPARILRVMPFMNQRGKRATMQVDHIDGSSQLVLDQPFVANDRKIYNTPATVRVGDSVSTTCTYDNPTQKRIGVGVLQDYELCDFIVLASPAHVLNNQSISLWYNSCIDGP